MLTAAVDAGEGLLGQEAVEAVAAGDLFHDLHRQLVVVTSYIDDGVDRRHLVLGRGGFVMLGLGQDADLPELLVQLRHEGLDTGLDRSEEMIAQLLPLGGGGAEKRAAGEDQVAAFVIQLFFNQEILLLRSHGWHDAGGVQPAEKLQDADGLFVEGFHGAQQGGFLVQGFSAVGAVSRGNAQDMLLDEGIGSRVPRSVTPGFKGGTEAAAGQRGSVCLAADQFLAGKLLDHAAAVHGRDERVVLFRSDGIQRLKPVSIMGGALFDGPVLHGVGYDAGDLGIQTATLVNCLMEGFVGFLRETLTHDGIIEHINPEIFFYERHRNHTFQYIVLIQFRRDSG